MAENTPSLINRLAAKLKESSKENAKIIGESVKDSFKSVTVDPARSFVEGLSNTESDTINLGVNAGKKVLGAAGTLAKGGYDVIGNLLRERNKTPEPTPSPKPDTNQSTDTIPDKVKEVERETEEQSLSQMERIEENTAETAQAVKDLGDKLQSSEESSKREDMENMKPTGSAPDEKKGGIFSSLFGGLKGLFSNIGGMFSNILGMAGGLLSSFGGIATILGSVKGSLSSILGSVGATKGSKTKGFKLPSMKNVGKVLAKGARFIPGVGLVIAGTSALISGGMTAYETAKNGGDFGESFSAGIQGAASDLTFGAIPAPGMDSSEQAIPTESTTQATSRRRLGRVRGRSSSSTGNDSYTTNNISSEAKVESREYSESNSSEVSRVVESVPVKEINSVENTEKIKLLKSELQNGNFAGRGGAKRKADIRRQITQLQNSQSSISEESNQTSIYEENNMSTSEENNTSSNGGFIQSLMSLGNIASVGMGGALSGILDLGKGNFGSIKEIISNASSSETFKSFENTLGSLYEAGTSGGSDVMSFLDSFDNSNSTTTMNNIVEAATSTTNAMEKSMPQPVAVTNTGGSMTNQNVTNITNNNQEPSMDLTAKSNAMSNFSSSQVF